MAQKRYGPLSRFLVSKDVFVTLVLFLFCNLFIGLILPEGINKTFALQATTGSIYLTLIWLSSYLLKSEIFSIFLTKLSEFHPKVDLEQPPQYREYLLSLLPATIVTQYCIINGDSLTWMDSFILIFCSISITAFLIILLPRLLENWAHRAFTVALMLSLVSFYIYMPILAKQYAWSEQGNLWIQSAYLVVLFCLLLYLIFYFKNFLLIFVPFYFVTNSLIYFTQYFDDSNAQTGGASTDLQTIIFDSTPDIYLLTYDAYVENETMLAYGIDNAAQEKHLENMGFKIYRGTYSIGRDSLRSLGSMFNWVDGEQKNKTLTSLKMATAGFNIVNRVLKENNYITHNITQPYFFPKDKQSNYDYAYGINDDLPLNALLITQALALGEFKFNIEQAGFERGSKAVEQAKEKIFRSDTPSPKFLYTHSGPGHSQNSGQCLRSDMERFKKNLQKFNVIMTEDIQSILDSDREAIVIIHGDHGPYLTGDCASMEKSKTEEITKLNLQDRFGSFLAIRWPDDSFRNFDDISVLQDVFPTIFAYLAKDKSILDTKVASKTSQLNGVYINKGEIVKGADDGQYLFRSDNEELPDLIPKPAAKDVNENRFSIDTLVTLPKTGLWGNENEPGWGVVLTEQADLIVANVFTYLVNGSTTWYMASCPLVKNRCKGELYEVRGGSALTDSWDGSNKSVKAIGEIDFTFNDPGKNVMHFNINGIVSSRQISRQVFGSTAANGPMTGLWGHDSESGWGVALTQQSDTISALLLTYDAKGLPVWFLSKNCKVIRHKCHGELYEITGGSPLTQIWAPNFEKRRKVGLLDISFVDKDKGSMHFVINGTSGSKQVTRQIFN